MKRHYTLQQRIFLLSALLIFIPITLYTAFVVSTTVRSAQKSYKDYTIFTMKKMGAAVENIFAELNRASLFIIGSYDITTYLSLPREQLAISSQEMFSAYNYQRYVKSTGEYITALQIRGFNGVTLSSGPLPMHISSTDSMRAWVGNGSAFWGVDRNLGGKDYIYTCRLLRHPQMATKHLGYAKIFMDTQSLRTFLAAENTEAVTYYLFDETGHTVFSLDPLEAPLPPEDFSPKNLLTKNGTSFVSVIGNKRYYVVPYTLAVNGWTLCLVSRATAVDQQIVAAILLLTSLTFVCLLLCLLLGNSLSHRILGPLYEVMAKMKQMEKEDFSARIDVKGNDEVAQLATQFNRMASKIDSLVDEVYKADIRKKEAELRALQAQINPHFLYNTLDMVYWTAKMENAPETSELIDALSLFFRSALTPAGEFTTVRNELEHLRYYVILRQQGKYPFDFNLDLDPQTPDCKTVKLVLQPLVENAIVHGIGQRADGKINVSIRRQGLFLVYTIEDNGAGVDVADIQQLMAQPLESTRGFGIRNVNDRIRLAFGPEYGLVFRNKPEGGTIVTVTFPFIKPEKEEGEP